MSSTDTGEKPPYPAFEDFIPGEITTYGRYEVTKAEVIEYATEFDRILTWMI